MSATIQTIERTSKRWKLLQSLGVVALCLGIVLLFNGDGIPWTGGCFALAGIIVYMYARIGAWWENG